MSVRRAHAKSRSGCSDCKRRRIKCDERRPNCGNCQKRGIRCSFHDFDPGRLSSPSNSFRSSAGSSPLIHVFASQGPEVIKPLVNDPFSREIQAKLLENLPPEERFQFENVLAYFATDTILTLSPGSTAQEAWRKAIPTFVNDFTFVLHGFLAISCLQLARSASADDERGRYQAMAATQMNLGMKLYGKEIEKIGLHNAEALLAFSTTLTTFTNYTAGIESREALTTLKGTSTEKEREKLILSSVDAICRTFRSIRGVLVILVPYWHDIKGGILEPILKRDWWPPPVPTTEKEIEDDRRLRHLETMWSRPGVRYDYSFDTLRAALKGLREAFALVSRLDDYTIPGDTSNPKIFDWTSLFDWPVSLSLEFIAQLEQRRWEAWVIVAHYAMLLHKMTGHIWLDGLGENIVTTAALVMREEDLKWIEWPIAKVGINLQQLKADQIPV